MLLPSLCVALFSQLSPTPELDAGSALRIEDLSLELLLDQPLASGDVGGFGHRLDTRGAEKTKSNVFVHGYATVDYTSQRGTHSFDAHYFNVFFGATLLERVFPELQLELEHGNALLARFAQVDVRLAEAAVVRAGLFLVPFGTYNEFLYPEYLAKVGRGPLVLTHANIIPTVWNDVGLQLRGRVPFGKHAFHYAAYLVNGLEQADPTPKDGVPSEGGGIRAMRGNYTDANFPNKSFGGRLGVELFEKAVGLGASAYRGIYTVEGSRWLTLVGLDAVVKWRALDLLIEGVQASQQVTAGELVKRGVYAVLAYRLLEWLEPAVAFDRQVLGGSRAENKTRTTFNLNVLPFEQLRLVIRASYTVSLSDTGSRDDIVLVQSSVGF